MNKKIQKPCYFYNTGGCYNDDGTPKSEDQCRYLHYKVNEPLEKPQHLKPPCKYYHLRRHCNNSYCVFGHAELSLDRWQKYFPNHEYPGHDYTRNGEYSWSTYPPTPAASVSPQPETNARQLKTAILLMLLKTLGD